MDGYEKSERSRRLPGRFFPIGSVARINGKAYDVAARPEITRPSQVCKGCALRSRNCDTVQCSKHDRVDGRYVWFIERKEDRNED